MKIAIGADSYGYAAKQTLLTKLKAEGHEVTDVGIHTPEPDTKILDYADLVAHAVSTGTAERGILLCMSGGAMCIRANRWSGVRALVAGNGLAMKHDREASDINVLCIGAYYDSPRAIEFMVDKFLKTEFEPLERRIKRLQDLDRPCNIP